jgi:hypothetical protein
MASGRRREAPEAAAFVEEQHCQLGLMVVRCGSDERGRRHCRNPRRMRQRGCPRVLARQRVGGLARLALKEARDAGLVSCPADVRQRRIADGTVCRA